jgi:RNA polymerase sigma factor (sigma-70 family)
VALQQTAGPSVGRLYCQHATVLREIAIRKFQVPPEDAEALVHEVFVGYMRSRDLVKDAESWLVGAICHSSRHYWRQQRNVQGLHPRIPDGGDDVIARIHRAILVNAVLRKLEPRCREVLRKHYLEGFSAAEMARQVATSRGYAEQTIHRCLKAARRVTRKGRA